MKIIDYIKSGFKRGNNVLIDANVCNLSAFNLSCRNYAALIWYNICDLLTDLAEDVTLTNTKLDDADKIYLFAAFKAFFYKWGKCTLQILFDDGFCVVGFDGSRFWLMNQNEYLQQNMPNGEIVIKPYNDNVSVYVMRSSTYISRQKSDKSICQPFLDFLDDVLNGSATISKRLGAVVIASPKTAPQLPVPAVLTDKDKEAIEKEWGEKYGVLNKQSNIMILPKEMDWTTINLAGLDLKTLEKTKLAILGIVDRIKVPANQVAIIDANTSKQIANGSELREGDKLKYKTFRRLFERTFVQMAEDLGLKITYSIYGEPKDETEVQI